MPVRRKRKPEKQSAQSSIRVTRKEGVMEHTSVDSRDTYDFESEPAYVRVGAGVTRNLGNFESLRVDVAITMPCEPEDVEDTFDDVAERVSIHLNDEVDQYLLDNKE